MKSTKILNTETEPLLVASLPARPNQPVINGGKSYTSYELRAAFDRLPMLLVERFNALISDIEDGSICDAINTDISDGLTLRQLFLDIKSGDLCWYLKDANGDPLNATLLQILERLGKLEEAIGK